MMFQEFKEKFEKKRVEEYPQKITGVPVLSVCVQTFQHVDFIKECLNGILMQKTDFPFEILLGDDESTDGTREICTEYAEKYPDRIRLFLHHRENNIAVNGQPTGRFNLGYNLFNTRGKYIALCEGDDYWTDPLKLQKQVDFLETNECFGACFTNAIIADHINKTKRVYNSPYQLKEGIVSNELIFTYGGGIYPTATLLFRKEHIAHIDFDIHEISGDELLLFTIANKTRIQYLDFISAVYNRWQGGIFSVIMNNKNKMLEYRMNELKGYNKFLKTLKSENKILLEKKRKEKILFIMEHSTSKLIYLKYFSYLGIKIFIKKIFK